MTFPGGVHPRDNKELSENCQIELFPRPKQVVVMLSQHIGAPCNALVAKRDSVVAGQKIGDNDSFVCAPVHSPVDGVVKDIALASHPVVGRSLAIFIDVDQDSENNKQPCPEQFGPDLDISEYSGEAIRDAIREAGVVGMGGAGFPTRVKLEPNEKSPKKVLIINACECEPFITCDYRMMIEWAYQIVAGIRLAKKAGECPVCYIGIEDNKPEAIKVMKDVLSMCSDVDNIEVRAVKTKYPQGGEKQLIKAIWGVDVPVGQIPPMIGVCVLNVATCAAIAEAVRFGNPLTHRAVTVTGEGINRPGNFYVPVGTPISELIDYCGGLNDRAAKVISGGPMMGFSIAELSMPITKTSGAITVLTKKDITLAKHINRQTPCIRCGRCLEVCPAKINPTKIAHAVKHEKLDVAEDYYMSSCIECGCCSYICPANIEIKGYINAGKVLQSRAKKQMAK